ncbi:hypothetical protein AVEN_48864-1 [Araneus ventricosus]|uniref:Uncharacterized protein n=1 Tax=Araneus ventricosus TaxID=182803 RepID=A0A4Y2AIW9_ARAVE|nr:hypothetical protein AVEN_48864-1 [Araneus ventricosus]
MATVSTPPPAFKTVFQTDLRPAFLRELNFPSPFLRFSLLCERLDPPFQRSYFSFMAHCAEWKKEPDENPNISTYRTNSHQVLVRGSPNGLEHSPCEYPALGNVLLSNAFICA